ncbi:MAG: GNAT family N-acetyltransferase [Thermoplasmatota archaeon]
MDADDFCIVPFHEGYAVETFDCGNDDLNDFLTTKEVAEYQADLLGKTYFVYRRDPWELVAYYTIASDRLEIPKDWVKRSMVNLRDVKIFPALLLGRLAVQTPLKGTGIGSIVLKHIFTEALDSNQAIRFVRLVAYHESLQFYRKRGFEFASDKDEEKADNTDAKPRLFFDLKKLPETFARVNIPSAKP